MTTRGSQPTRLGDVLGGVLRQHGLEDQLKRMTALDIWPDVVGGHIAAATRARSVSDATLVVEVRSSGWLMELNMMKGDLLARVNERMADAPLERLVFVLAETG